MTCNNDRSFCLHARAHTHTHVHLLTNISTRAHTFTHVHTHPPQCTRTHTHTAHVYIHTCSSIPHMHTHTCARACIECAHMHPHVHRAQTRAHTQTYTHVHHTPIHTPRLADGQKELLLGCLFSRMRAVLPTQVGARDVQVASLPWVSFLRFLCCTLRASDILSVQSSAPLLLDLGLGGAGCRHRPQCPSIRVRAQPSLAHVRPTPNLDMTSFPLCTCHFKSPGPSGPVPRVGLGEAGQLRVGGALLAPRGLLEPGQCCGN